MFVEMSVAVTNIYVDIPINSQSNIVTMSSATPVHEQKCDKIGCGLCNGLQEESGSGLVCAKTPAVSCLSGCEREQGEEDGSSALYLGQTLFVSNFRCLFEHSQEYQMDGVYCITDSSNKFSQMSFHDVRYRLSVTEGLKISGFCLLQCRWLRYATWD